MDKHSSGYLSSSNISNARYRRLSAAVADPTGRKNPTKSIFAGMTHTHTTYLRHCVEYICINYCHSPSVYSVYKQKPCKFIHCRWISWRARDHDNISYWVCEDTVTTGWEGSQAQVHWTSELCPSNSEGSWLLWAVPWSHLPAVWVNTKGCCEV